jgi:hypothetical protein
MAVLEGGLFDGLFGDLPFAFLEVEVVELFEACKVIVDFVNQKIELSFLFGNLHIRGTIDLLCQTFHGHGEAFQIHSCIIFPFFDRIFMEYLIHLTPRQLRNTCCI